MRVSIKDVGNSSLVYIKLCNVCSPVSITPNRLLLASCWVFFPYFEAANRIHGFLGWTNLIYVAHFIFPNFIYFILLCTVL